MFTVIFDIYASNSTLSVSVLYYYQIYSGFYLKESLTAEIVYIKSRTYDLLFKSLPLNVIILRF